MRNLWNIINKSIGEHNENTTTIISVIVNHVLKMKFFPFNFQKTIIFCDVPFFCQAKHIYYDVEKTQYLYCCSTLNCARKIYSMHKHQLDTRIFTMSMGVLCVARASASMWRGSGICEGNNFLYFFSLLCNMVNVSFHSLMHICWRKLCGYITRCSLYKNCLWVYMVMH